MKLMLLSAIIFSLIVFSGAFIYDLLIPPYGSTLLHRYAVKDNAVLDALVEAKLGSTSDLAATTEYADGSYYILGVNARTGGGIEAIARLVSTTTVQVVWQGQDAPPCSTMEQNRVPIGLVTECFAYPTRLVDRTSWARYIYTYILGISY